MRYTVRFALEEDFDNWWSARKDALRDHPDAFGQTWEDAIATPEREARDRFITFNIQGENTIFVAVDPDGTLGGMLGLFVNAGVKRRHSIGIWGVYVRPEARGHGVGDALMAAVVTHARTMPGVLQIELTVSTHNHSAARLYERHGFVRWGIRPRALVVDGTPIDEDEMTLMLDAPAQPANSKGSA